MHYIDYRKVPRTAKGQEDLDDPKIAVEVRKDPKDRSGGAGKYGRSKAHQGSLLDRAARWLLQATYDYSEGVCLLVYPIETMESYANMKDRSRGAERSKRSQLLGCGQPNTEDPKPLRNQSSLQLRAAHTTHNYREG